MLSSGLVLNPFLGFLVLFMLVLDFVKDLFYGII